MHRILVINPGSTSTKIAIYHDLEEQFMVNIEHSSKELNAYDNIYEQTEMRKNLILDILTEKGITIQDIDVIVARGGLLPPVSAGAYEVNEDMKYQLRYHPQNEHASNLGAIIADSIGNGYGIKSYIYDPVTVDELEPIARITGLKEMHRMAIGHNLNMRAAAIKYAESVGKSYNELTVIVAHLGGGITISLHKSGRIIDIISDEEGPFSPERSGGLPLFQVLKMATTEKGDYNSFMKAVKSQGGLMSHLGTTDSRKVEARISSGDGYAKLIYEAMAHNVAKSIGKLAVVVSGKVDTVILTGGIAHSKMFTEWIKDRTEFIAPVVIIPGENEMEALAKGVWRVVTGQEKAHIFTP